MCISYLNILFYEKLFNSVSYSNSSYATPWGELEKILEELTRIKENKIKRIYWNYVVNSS